MKKFSKHLINLLYDSFQDRKLIIVQGDHTCSLTFNKNEGLQQGNENALLLFNVYNADIITMFNMNSEDSEAHLLASADDVMAYTIRQIPTRVTYQT